MKPHLCPLCHGKGEADYKDELGYCRICGGKGYLILNEPSDWYVPAVPYPRPYPLPYWPYVYPYNPPTITYTVTSGSVTCNSEPITLDVVPCDVTSAISLLVSPKLTVS